MARIFRFHMYSHEIEDELVNYKKFGEYNIQVRNQLGSDVAEELEDEFSDRDDVAIANEVSPPGERGGGGEGPIFPLVELLFVGLSVFVVTSKGFFDELGRELAKRIIKKLFDKNETTELIYTKNSQYFTIIVPRNTKIKHSKYLEREIKKLKEEGKYIYNEKSKKLMKV